MKKKFILSVGFGVLWLTLSIWLSIPWIQSAAEFFATGLCVGGGHGGGVSAGLSDERPVLFQLCAHNEEESIAGTIQALLCQNYGGRIWILAVDNAFTDGTKARIQAMARLAPQNWPVRYLYCGQTGLRGG